MDKGLKTGARWLACMAACAVALGLAGCSGTIKQDTRIQGDVSKVEGVAKVVARMSPDASRQQADNPQFNREELAGFMRRRLESKNLMSPAATHQVDIVVTDIRVRSAMAAVMLGILAGDDHVNGVVRILDADGKPLRSFDVKTNYAFGGVGGGQDSTRMNWLYDKFAEMATIELEKVISTPKVAAAAPVAVQATTFAASAPQDGPQLNMASAGALPDAGIPVDDAAAVPVTEKGRENYREWLTKKFPRAFVVADGGRSNGTWSTRPLDPMLPTDPVERALQLCRTQGKTHCTLYAVDNKVVYVKPAATAAR